MAQDAQEVDATLDEVESAAPVVKASVSLEDEGEIAADYLEELLDIADLDGDIEIDVVSGRAYVAVVSDTSGLERLVGKDGRVLDALQELTRLAVQEKTGDRSRLVLDVADYRTRRKEALLAIAARAISEVQASGIEQELEPLNAFERKIVHDAVAAAGLRSESRGSEPERYVVVLPA